MTPVAAAAALGIVVFSTDCADQRTAPVEDVAISRSLTSESPKTAWETLPAIERLKKLLSKEYPVFIGFDRQKEVTLATAQAYCEHTKCNVSFEELIRKTHYIDEKTYVEKVIKEESIRRLTPEEIKEIEKTRKQGFALASSSGEIYINKDALNRSVETISVKQPDIIRQIGNKDIRTVEEINIQVHEWTHENRSNAKEEPITFDGFSIRLPGRQSPVNFDILDNFDLQGKDSQGVRYFITGGNEAITDFATLILVRRKMGLYYRSNPYYGQGANLIEKLNKMADISDEEFLRHVNGELSSVDLLIKWGAFKRDPSRTDLKEGIRALTMVGLAVQGLIVFQDAERDINLRLKLQHK